MRNIHIRILMPFLITLISGCASLENYTIKTMPVRNYLTVGSYEEALEALPRARSRNEVLIHMERATLLQDMGSFDESAKEFELAASKITDFERKAVISATKSTSQLSSLVINEQTLPYEGQDFEKIIVHTLNAMNYLMMGNLEGARVEIRRTYQRQKELYEKHEKDIVKAENEGGSGWKSSFAQADSARLKAIEEKASSSTSVYQNALGYYVSSVVYELNGETDEAYIDLKEAIKAAPWSIPIQRDLIRLAKSLGFYDDLARWQEMFGAKETPQDDGIDVFVVLRVGLTPVKEAVQIPIPIRDGFVFASFPVYRFEPSRIMGGKIGYGSTQIDTSMVFSVEAAAAKNLIDQFPMLFAKQIVRTTAKAATTHQLSEELGFAGAILGTIGSAVTEQADLRTWSTLPAEVQVARFVVPRKTKELIVSTCPNGLMKKIEIPDNAKHVVVYGRATDSNLAIHTKIF